MAQASRWRKLSIEVEDDSVRVDFDGVARRTFRVGPMLEQHRQLMAKVDPQYLITVPQFKPQGGLGLYVRQSSASFCRVVVEPP
jgi:hypothetical protein